MACNGNAHLPTLYLPWNFCGWPLALLSASLLCIAGCVKGIVLMPGLLARSSTRRW